MIRVGTQPRDTRQTAVDPRHWHLTQPVAAYVGSPHVVICYLNSLGKGRESFMITYTLRGEARQMLNHPEDADCGAAAVREVV